MGYGTAHLCPHIEARGGRYTGIDYSDALLADNRRRFPRARFFRLGTPIPETFDIVTSLYTIEHVVDPPAYLEAMWRYCRTGGMVGIICPEFVQCHSFPPSVFYGRTPRRFREKCRALDLADACRHLLDLTVKGPLWKKRARRDAPGAFWINVQPSILHGADYTRDADAVHMVQLRDLSWFFEQKGAEILRTSASIPNVSPEILRYNCYMVAQKPPCCGRSGTPARE